MVSPYVHAHGRDFNLVIERHTTKPPNFPAIRYILSVHVSILILYYLNRN